MGNIFQQSFFLTTIFLIGNCKFANIYLLPFGIFIFSFLFTIIFLIVCCVHIIISLYCLASIKKLLQINLKNLRLHYKYHNNLKLKVGFLIPTMTFQQLFNRIKIPSTLKGANVRD